MPLIALSKNLFLFFLNSLWFKRKLEISDFLRASDAPEGVTHFSPEGVTHAPGYVTLTKNIWAIISPVV